MPVIAPNSGGRFLRPSRYDANVLETVGSLDIAPPGFWGVRCAGPEQHWFPRPRDAELDMNLCRECRTGLAEYLALVDDDRDLVSDPEAVITREWWHSTPSDSIDLAREDAMHWGSYESALERAVPRLAPFVSMDRPILLFRATLKAGLTVHPDVMLERPSRESDHRYAASLLGRCDIVRYVNGTEAPGAVSLLLLPSSLLTVSLEGELVSRDGVTSLVR